MRLSLNCRQSWSLRREVSQGNKGIAQHAFSLDFCLELYKQDLFISLNILPVLYHERIPICLRLPRCTAVSLPIGIRFVLRSLGWKKNSKNISLQVQMATPWALRFLYPSLIFFTHDILLNYGSGFPVHQGRLRLVQP